ncbi:FAD-binding oxidoreductase [Streptomyces sp. NPDC051014]|uniref:FAD-binding oxidoreductase n=1 Tax=Streptomyces sp. NPDC051014 TaxID=3155751 RepID=UPI00340EF6E6
MSFDSIAPAATALPEAALHNFEHELVGSALLPRHNAYAAACASFERSVAHRPALVVKAGASEDVSAAVRFAGDHGLGVAVQSSGHGACVPADDSGLLLSTRELRGVRVHPGTRWARVHAGARWVDVLNATSRFGLAPLHCGALNSSAVSGLLGGGIGPLSRRYGQTADHVEEIRVVTADGSRLVTSAREDSGLFWGLRGGRGQLGVVTSATLELVPVPVVYGGTLTFDPADTQKVLTRYAQWVADVPDTVASRLSLRRLPALSAALRHANDPLVLQITVLDVEPGPTSEALLSPLLGAAPIVDGSLDRMPYAAAARDWDEPGQPVATLSRALVLRRLGKEALGAIASFAKLRGGHHFSLTLHHMGGALARRAVLPGAAGYFPGAEFALRTAVHLDHTQGVRAALQAQEALRTELAPWVYPKGSPGFLSGLDLGPAAARMAFGPSWDALRALKDLYDPTDMFRYEPSLNAAYGH